MNSMRRLLQRFWFAVCVLFILKFTSAQWNGEPGCPHYFRNRATTKKGLASLAYLLDLTYLVSPQMAATGWWCSRVAIVADNDEINELKKIIPKTNAKILNKRSNLGVATQVTQVNAGETKLLDIGCATSRLCFLQTLSWIKPGSMFKHNLAGKY